MQMYASDIHLHIFFRSDTSRYWNGRAAGKALAQPVRGLNATHSNQQQGSKILDMTLNMINGQ